MKTPARDRREPGIPALTLPASDPHPSPHFAFFAFFAVKKLCLIARVSDLRPRRPVSSVVRNPLFRVHSWFQPSISLHRRCAKLHQIAVNCGKMRLRDTPGGMPFSSARSLAASQLLQTSPRGCSSFDQLLWTSGWRGFNNLIPGVAESQGVLAPIADLASAGLDLMTASWEGRGK